MPVPASPSLRRNPRFSASIPVRVATPPNGTPLPFRTVDLSRSGAFIASKNPPAVGLPLRVTAKGPQGPISVQGRVARVICPERASAVGVPSGFGVEFLRVPQDVQVQIDALVEVSRKDSPSASLAEEHFRAERKRLRGWVPAREVPLLGRLLRSVVVLSESPYHERLEVDLNAPVHEVRIALRARIGDFEEVIYRRCSRPVQRVAARARALLVEAAAALSDPERRDLYVSSMTGGIYGTDGP